jgi:uncharacterized protein
LNSEISIAERLGLRARPSGFPLMHQNWGKLLFMHWPIDAQLLRPLIPPQLSIDTFDGSAWIGVVPFTMWGIRASFLPSIPGTNAFHELNVRTYVHLDGVPGVWFLSLDAANRLACRAARGFYHLPYFHARMSLEQAGQSITYSSWRSNHGRAEFKATWRVGERLPESTPESLEFFLTERYCFYSSNGGRLYRARIFHRPWPLRCASLATWRSTMIEALGLGTPSQQPLTHYSEELNAEIWPLAKVWR